MMIPDGCIVPIRVAHTRADTSEIKVREKMVRQYIRSNVSRRGGTIPVILGLLE